MNDHILALPIGSKIHHYEIESVLGMGGFGIVYKARHTLLDSPVAIKEFLPSEIAARSGATVMPHDGTKQPMFDECLKRFIEEGKTLRGLNHPNIIHCGDLFLENGTAYIVMDFEDGLPLDKLLTSLEEKGGSYNEQQIMHILEPLLDGLEYIHNQGVLHRDIKPGNVFIRRSDGQPVLIDFGAAKQNYGEVSQSRAPYTEFYAPIEQIEGHGFATPATDIHALGAMLYRIVCQKIGPRAENRIKALAFGDPDPLEPASLLAQGRYSENLLNTIDLCLQVKEEERPANVRALRECLSGEILAAEKDDDANIIGDPIEAFEPQELRASVQRIEKPAKWAYVLALFPLLFILAKGVEVSIDSFDLDSDDYTSAEEDNSEWSSASEEAEPEIDNRIALYVSTSPANATVKIMNISPKYHDGILLEPGKYDVYVVKDGYRSKRQWVTLAQGDRKKELYFDLEYITDTQCRQGDCINGYGTYYYSHLGSEDYYVGNFRDGMRHGKGTYYHAADGTYVGQWDAGDMHGYGKRIWASGDIYEGNWVRNVINGKGSYVWPDGGTYEGDWINTQMHGYGKRTWPNGDVYQGDWVRDVKQGKGKYTWTDGETYEGDWDNDQMTGWGKVTYPNGSVWEGRVVEGVKQD